MRESPAPEPGDGELLIRTMAATICTSDLIDIKENPFGIELPVIMGHEGAGVVEKTGGGVTDFAPGDRVAAHPVMHCGRCISCRRGLFHLCDDMEHLGLNRGGTFADYFVIRADRARRLPDALSFGAGALMEPVCVCLESLERANVREGSNVLIIGDGPFGIITAKLARSRNPAGIVLLGRHGFRLSRAGDGVVAINERECGDIAGAAIAAAGGEFDSCIICAADKDAVGLGISVLRSRGTLCLFSGLSGKTPVDLFRVHVKELNICGSCNDADYLDDAINFLCDATLDIGGVITHNFAFGEWERAFRQAGSGKDSGLKAAMIF